MKLPSPLVQKREQAIYDLFRKSPPATVAVAIKMVAEDPDLNPKKRKCRMNIGRVYRIFNAAKAGQPLPPKEHRE